MIVDSIDNIMNYEALLPSLKKGMEVIRGLAKQAVGR